MFVPNSSVGGTGEMAELEEPPEMQGKFRWQVIGVVSEDVSTSEEKRAMAISEEESGESSREKNRDDPTEGLSSKETKTLTEDLGEEDTETVYRRGVYLGSDATLKDLRNQFLDTAQLEPQKLHFHFLKSDVPGDKIEIDTEDEVYLSQLEGTLIQHRTLYIEHTEPSKKSWTSWRSV